MHVQIGSIQMLTPIICFSHSSLEELLTTQCDRFTKDEVKSQYRYSILLHRYNVFHLISSML